MSSAHWVVIFLDVADACIGLGLKVRVYKL